MSTQCATCTCESVSCWGAFDSRKSFMVAELWSIPAGWWAPRGAVGTGPNSNPSHLGQDPIPKKGLRCHRHLRCSGFTGNWLGGFHRPCEAWTYGLHLGAVYNRLDEVVYFAVNSVLGLPRVCSFDWTDWVLQYSWFQGSVCVFSVWFSDWKRCHSFQRKHRWSCRAWPRQLKQLLMQHRLCVNRTRNSCLEA